MNNLPRIPKRYRRSGNLVSGGDGQEDSPPPLVAVSVVMNDKPKAHSPQIRFRYPFKIPPATANDAARRTPIEANR